MSRRVERVRPTVVPSIPDYLDRLGVTIEVTPTHCMVRHGVGSAMFGGIGSDELRAKLNEAMQVAVSHYADRIAAAGVAMPRARIEEVALAVVIAALYVYNQWRQTHALHRDHPLRIEPDDLASVQANDQCWFYCQKTFGKRYLAYAAALTGMTNDAFQQYEQGRRRYFDR